MFWNETFLEKLRQHIAGRISAFQYCTGGEWHNADILSKSVSGNDIVLLVCITAQESFVISGVRIVDENSNTIGQTEENITKKTDALTVEWKFPVYEIQEVI